MTSVKQAIAVLAEKRECPNCGASHVEDHPHDGCMLHAVISVLRGRENMTEDALQKLHAETNVDALWDDIGPVLDKLEAGGYRR